MGVALKFIDHTATLIKRLFTGQENAQGTPGEVYRNVQLLLKKDEDPDYRCLGGKERKMLARRLKQYQRVGWKAGDLERQEAFRKLQKEWKRILRNRLRKLHFERLSGWKSINNSQS